MTAVREGAVEWALVPIENSLDGSVTVTLDLLADERGGLEIVGEALLAVSHSLIARETIELERDRHRALPPAGPRPVHALPARPSSPHAEVLPASSTAEAVRMVAGGAERVAAQRSGTALAAEIYGAVVLRDDVQDRDDNATRFVWLARPASACRRRRCGRSRRGQRVEDIARLLGRRRRQPRLARALPRRVRAARDQPHEDRVAPDARAASGTTCSSPTSQGGLRERAGGERGRGPARVLPGGARARLLPSGLTRPGVRGTRDALAASRHGLSRVSASLHSGCDGCPSSTSSSGVRAALRAPAARA